MAKAIIVLLQTLLGGQLLFPILRQLARYEPVLRLQQTVMPAAPLCLLGSTFEALLPQLVELFALLFDVAGCF